ncbi:hypothetical protein LTR37_019372 [Vermiconidia calcicola]|uniref:Uncharacterized protein n=1 Tax=Vermiconidia calcicola TaxID=1690605 RepID=A0ACC3ME87_9PEZI|nr:hypothetical protein LTR37_019372 [Vermiconidia calcicola]
MAQTQEAIAGQKRGPGRPPKAAQPALKKTRLSTTKQTPLASPSTHSPAQEKAAAKKLPPKISDNRPLPTLAEPQSPSLPNSDYQSIAASAVLQSSLDRSRSQWIHDGVFERYWTKPESGKNARPPPPNNPELKWQKHKGPCRLRIEPHVFEAEIYVEEKPKPQVKQYVPPPPAGNGYGQRYGRPQQQSQYYQGRALPPIQHTQSPANTLPPITSMSPAPTVQQTPRVQQSPPQQTATPTPQEKKASPDPVISMLATRASSDPELKTLMKEVATGNATQDQLKVFQGHIDELTRVINEKKKKDEETEAAAQAAKEKQQKQQSEMIQYDGPADNVRMQRPPAYPTAHQQPTHPLHQQQPQQPWSQPTQPVILAFTTPGATESRFLFPRHAILEPLSPQHLLASFILTRRGIDPALFDPEKDYWQPITLMVEVAYNREHLLEHIKRWCLPAEEVRREMEVVMARCERVPEGAAYLALRLPVKGGAEAEDLPHVVVEDLGIGLERKGGPKIKFVKEVKRKKEGGVGKPAEAKKPTSTATAVPEGAAATEEQKDTPTTMTGAGEDGGRPRRTTRKSVRISEG